MSEPIEATVANMSEHYGEGVFAFSPTTGEEYSANPGDYWFANDNEPLVDANGEPMFLVRKRTIIEPL